MAQKTDNQSSLVDWLSNNDSSEGVETKSSFDKFDHTYWTGCQAHLFLNGSEYVGDCFGVSYDINSNKQPIYGYRSTHFDRMAEGQVVIQGVILINLSDFRYFPFATSMATEEEPLSDSAKQAFLSRMGLIDRLTQVEVDELQKIAIEAFINENIENNEAQVKSAPLQHKPFDIVTVLGQPNDIDKPYYERVNVTLRRLRDCYILGESTEIMSNDKAILQAYPFIARDEDFSSQEIREFLDESLSNLEDTTQSILDKLSIDTPDPVNIEFVEDSFINVETSSNLDNPKEVKKSTKGVLTDNEILRQQIAERFRAVLESAGIESIKDLIEEGLSFDQSKLLKNALSSFIEELTALNVFSTDMGLFASNGVLASNVGPPQPTPLVLADPGAPNPSIGAIDSRSTPSGFGRFMEAVSNTPNTFSEEEYKLNSFFFDNIYPGNESLKPRPIFPDSDGITEEEIEEEKLDESNGGPIDTQGADAGPVSTEGVDGPENLDESNGGPIDTQGADAGPISTEGVDKPDPDPSREPKETANEDEVVAGAGWDTYEEEEDMGPAVDGSSAEDWNSYE